MRIHCLEEGNYIFCSEWEIYIAILYNRIERDIISLELVDFLIFLNILLKARQSYGIYIEMRGRKDFDNREITSGY